MQPVPFEIVDNGEQGRTATNGTATLTVVETETKLFKRRAVKGLSLKPAAELAIPMLNQLASELIEQLDMSAEDIAARLAEISAMVQPKELTKIEWAVAELDGVRVYFDGLNVLVTKQDLRP